MGQSNLEKKYRKNGGHSLINKMPDLQERTELAAGKYQKDKIIRALAYQRINEFTMPFGDRSNCSCGKRRFSKFYLKLVYWKALE